MKKLTFSLLFASSIAFGQFFEHDKKFTKEDTLKGSNTLYRNFWDVKKYDLSVEPDFDSKSIKGNNKITFEITKDILNPVFQVDLQKPMKADKVECSFPTIDGFKQVGDFIFISAKKSFKKGEKYTINIMYSGKPTIAKNAPWDGGWVFKKDKNGKEYNVLAGHNRNKKMALFSDALIAFWDGKSTGTKNMIEEAKKLDLQVRIVKY